MLKSLNSPKKKMTILFTHDLHDHVLPFKVEKNNETLELGGYARLQSAINEERAIDPDLLLVDAGDFSMGSLFQSLYSTDAPELRLLGQMNYDVTTLGNHEYDFRSTGLTSSLNAAKNSGDMLPQIVQANVSFPLDKSGILSPSLTKLKQSMDNYGVKKYTIIERNGIKIGVFGLMGKDSAADAPMSEVKFTDALKKAKSIVNTLKQKQKVDLIVCLSHSGTWEDKSKSEDEILAKKVPEIDVIISGHTHTKLQKPIIIDNTIIASCGQYCENLGILSISQSTNKRWKLNSYNLKQINNNLPDDPAMSQSITKFKNLVQEKYLSNFDMKFDEVLATSPFNFVQASDTDVKNAEGPLGNLISDSYIYAVKKAEGENYKPITAAIVPSGTIRGSFVKGNITVSDAFTSSSLGVGADGISGYPLISVYLTGKELKTACEVDASISTIMNDVQLYISGIKYEFNPNRLILNRVTNATLQKPDGTLEEINDKKLYRVVAGLYSGQMLFHVGNSSHGLLSIVPKTKDGVPITDFEAHIIKDSTSGKNNEVKEWFAIAEYMKSFDKVNGVPQIPEYYNQTHDRKIVSDKKNVAALVAKPNGIALTAYTIVALTGFVIVRIVKYKKIKNVREII